MTKTPFKFGLVWPEFVINKMSLIALNKIVNFCDAQNVQFYHIDNVIV